MSALREEIRAILREEIAALGAEVSQPRSRQVERVQIASSAELTRFAQDLVRRAAEPEFAERIARGDIVFELASEPAAIGAPAIVSGPPRQEPAMLDKNLITERDIDGLGNTMRSLRIAAHSRLTPLARDEARRKGIRIERTET